MNKKYFFILLAFSTVLIVGVWCVFDCKSLKNKKPLAYADFKAVASKAVASKVSSVTTSVQQLAGAKAVRNSNQDLNFDTLARKNDLKNNKLSNKNFDFNKAKKNFKDHLSDDAKRTTSATKLSKSRGPSSTDGCHELKDYSIRTNLIVDFFTRTNNSYKFFVSRFKKRKTIRLYVHESVSNKFDDDLEYAADLLNTIIGKEKIKIDFSRVKTTRPFAIDDYKNIISMIKTKNEWIEKWRSKWLDKHNVLAYVRPRPLKGNHGTRFDDADVVFNSYFYRWNTREEWEKCRRTDSCASSAPSLFDNYVSYDKILNPQLNDVFTIEPSIVPSSSRPKKTDAPFFEVALHELMHLIGLEHTSQKQQTSIMTTGLRSHQHTNKGLSEFDKAHIRCLYPAAPASVPVLPQAGTSGGAPALPQAGGAATPQAMPWPNSRPYVPPSAGVGVATYYPSPSVTQTAPQPSAPQVMPPAGLPSVQAAAPHSQLPTQNAKSQKADASIYRPSFGVLMGYAHPSGSQLQAAQLINGVPSLFNSIGGFISLPMGATSLYLDGSYYYNQFKIKNESEKILQQHNAGMGLKYKLSARSPVRPYFGVHMNYAGQMYECKSNSRSCRNSEQSRNKLYKIDWGPQLGLELGAVKNGLSLGVDYRFIKNISYGANTNQLFGLQKTPASLRDTKVQDRSFIFLMLQLHL